MPEVCIDCKKPCVPTGITTGYGEYTDGKVCFPCCGLRDAQAMRAGDRIILYFDGRTISNWPGSLRIAPVAIHVGRHNIARTQTIVRFFGPDGAKWSGRQYGGMNQLLRCRKLKPKQAKQG